MSPRSCGCLLCAVEAHLLTELHNDRNAAHLFRLAGFDDWRDFSSPSALLGHLRTAHADPGSDDLYRALLAARNDNPQILESFLVLAFLPMLHRTVRRVAQHQPTLSTEDIAQQTLSTLLQVLRSQELQVRTSHYAFAISRAVKRQVFEWANRESGHNGPLNHDNGVLLGVLTIEEPFERHALLRHFLHRCVTRGLLSDEEFDFLVQFKLDRDSPADDAGSNGTSSNAMRQRLKRLLAKLRRFAR